MILDLIKSLFQSPEETCFNLYKKAKKRKPNKPEKDYLKLILLTKPPFDYQSDQIIENTLDEFKSIDNLAGFITNIPNDSYLWKSRSRNLKRCKEKITHRNNLFFKEFWS